MKKTILIPIDFTTESLEALKLALNEPKAEKVEVVLMYSSYLNDSITDLLFYSPNKIIQTLYTSEFHEALSVIKNHHESLVSSISVELFHGTNVRALENFLIGKNVDDVYISKDYFLKKIRKNSFNPLPLIKKLNTKIVEV